VRNKEMTLKDRMLRSAGTLRAVDEEKRTASFTAATERAVKVGPGPGECLRMAGCDLTRFRKSPVVLDSHQRDSIDAVIGRAVMTVRGRELHADITFAPTERGEHAWQLVRGGYVRAVSVGYQVDEGSVRQLRAGEFDGDGESRIDGPASVVNRWQVMELSIVPVGADEDAVRRSFYQSITPARRTAPAKKTNRAASRMPAARKGNVTKGIYRERVMAICPAALRDVAESLMAQHKSVDQIRRALLAEQRHRCSDLSKDEVLAALGLEVRGKGTGSPQGGSQSKNGANGGADAKSTDEVAQLLGKGASSPKADDVPSESGAPASKDSTATESDAERGQVYHCPECGHEFGPWQPEPEPRAEEVELIEDHDVRPKKVTINQGTSSPPRKKALDAAAAKARQDVADRIARDALIGGLEGFTHGRIERESLGDLRGGPVSQDTLRRSLNQEHLS
jgi:hypothetical protein